MFHATRIAFKARSRQAFFVGVSIRRLPVRRPAAAR
jgi:hypothetical protein